MRSILFFSYIITAPVIIFFYVTYYILYVVGYLLYNYSSTARSGITYFRNTKTYKKYRVEFMKTFGPANVNTPGLAGAEARLRVYKATYPLKVRTRRYLYNLWYEPDALWWFCFTEFLGIIFGLFVISVLFASEINPLLAPHYFVDINYILSYISGYDCDFWIYRKYPK